LLVGDRRDSQRVLVSGTLDDRVRHLPMGHKSRRKREYEVQLAQGLRQSLTRTLSSPITTEETLLRFLMLLQTKRCPWPWGSGIRGKRRWVGSAQNTVPAGVPQVQPLPLTNLEAYHADLWMSGPQNGPSLVSACPRSHPHCRLPLYWRIRRSLFGSQL
jgi:hypothetical protein